MNMTVKEIKEFVKNLRHRVDIFVNRGWAIDGLVNDYTKSADTIEKLLEEVQQYREIGTVEDVVFYKKCYDEESYEYCGEYGTDTCGCKRRMEYLEKKVAEIDAIGTIEEFKALKEKNEPKKVDEDYCCPICHTCGMDDDGIKGTYCTDCGQKLDWE